MEGFINIITLNVGLSSTFAGICTLATINNADIILLQEVRGCSDELNSIMGKLGFECEVNVNKDNPSKPGTAIAWRRTLLIKEVFTLLDCRLQVALLGKVAIINLYAPSGTDKKHQRELFFSKDVFDVFNMFPRYSYILSGDFNCVLSPLDIENSVGFNQKSSPALQELIACKRMFDVFRHSFPRRREYTFFRPGRSSSRLDRFYLSPQISETFNVSHIPSLSDHCAVLLSIKVTFEKNKSAPNLFRTYWKLNNSILEDEDFLPSFKLLWNKMKEETVNHSNMAVWWNDVARPEIKDFCVAFSKHKRAGRMDIKFLLSYLRIVLFEQNWEEVVRVKSEIHNIVIHESMGIVIRSRYQQNAEEEKGSIYHAGREARNRKNNIGALKVDGIVVKDSADIENIVTSFFTALFNGHHNRQLEDTGSSFIPDYTKLNEFLSDLGSLNDFESEQMHADVLVDDLDDILKQCKNNKSPGLDGLTYEFYKKVWSVIRLDFRDIIQCQLDNLALIESNKMGATRLVSKVLGTPQVDELRPITLLNSDYKLLSKLLVKRMKPAMPTVIQSSQLCSVGDRNILFGVNNVLSSIFHVKNRRKKGCLLSLDFFKAYDRVLLDYLLNVMRKMNFSDTFCNWIKMMHAGARTKFILTRLSNAIEVSFSIRQGDPMAMLLFILYIEPLFLYLERNLTGLRVAGFQQILEAYCDDVNVMTDDLDDLVRVDNAVTNFEAVSGAILSRGMKCKIFGFGSWKGKIDWPINYVRTEVEIKVFGIFLQDSYHSLLKRNWDYRFGRFSSCIKSWSSRHFPSLTSKVEVVKTYGLSRIYYVASILPITKSRVQKFESLIGNFIWKSSGWLLRVALSEVKNSLQKGGLNLVCVMTMCNSLLTSQFLRLLKSSHLKAQAHVNSWIGDTLSDLMPNFGQNVVQQNTPDYFCHLESLIVMGKIDDLITVTGWKRVTNKALYTEQARSFPLPKVQVEADSLLNYDEAWKRITSPVFSSSVRDASYLLLHNKLATKERLFRVGLSGDPFCHVCPGSPICDLEHFFCLCIQVQNVWPRIRNILINLIGVDIPNVQLINYSMPKSSNENEAIWILGNYISKAWSILSSGTKVLKEEEFFGFLKFKFKTDQNGARVTMNCIQGL